MSREAPNITTSTWKMDHSLPQPLLDRLMFPWKLRNKSVRHNLLRQWMMLICYSVFAPIAVLMPYETVEEAIEIANGTRYGLGASVFGPDQKQALKVAKQLECGMVSINDFGVFYVSSESQSIFMYY
jgi:hypothetical protein